MRPSGRRLLLVLAFAFRISQAVVVGAVGKWESRAFCEISKGVWEPVETCFWFSPASMLPPFPPRFSGPSGAGFPPAVVTVPPRAAQIESTRSHPGADGSLLSVSPGCTAIGVFRSATTGRPIATVLSLSTTRSVCTEKTSARSLRLQPPKCRAPSLPPPPENFSLNSAMYRSRRNRFAASSVRDPRHPQLLRQPVLPRPEVPLRPPPRLRRVRRNRLNPQFLHRSPHLRRPALVHLPARCRRVEKVASPVAVQRAEQPLASRPPPAVPPSPSPSIPLPPIARSRSRWSRRPESRSGRNHRSSCNHRCLLPSMCSNIPGSGLRGRRPPVRSPLPAPWPPAPRPAAPASPRCSSPRSRALSAASREMQHAEVEVLLLIQRQHLLRRLSGIRWILRFPASGRTARHSRIPHTGA